MDNHDPNSDPVVLVGGGFGGLTTALALCRYRNRPPIILIEPKNHFVFLPLLYELLSKELSSWEVAPSYESLLRGKGIVLIQEYVTKIDTYQKIVSTASGLLIKYSKVILSTGSKPDTFGIPGVSKYALMFNNLLDVEILRNVINSLKNSSLSTKSFLIIGGGPAGVELACKVFDLLGQNTEIHLIERQARLLPQGKAFNQEQSLKAIEVRGIRVHLLTEVLEVTADNVYLKSVNTEDPYNFQIPHQGVIWTAGTKPVYPEIIPMPSMSKSRIRIDSNLNVFGIENMMAIGDVSFNEDTLCLPTAQVAMQQGEIAANNVICSINGLNCQSFQAKDFGEMLSLGIGNASITGLGLTIAGSIAFKIRRLIYLSKTPNLSLTIRSATSWFLGNTLKC